MPPKTIIFAGAPTSSSLTWEPATLLDDFSPPFTWFLNLDARPAPPAHNTTSWRSLPLTRQRLETGLSQVHAYPDSPADLFTAGDSQALASQFYDHSLASHTAPAPPPPSGDETGETSFLTTSTSTSFGSNAAPAPPPQLQDPHLSDLEDVPAAAALLALHPQTVTLNLIAGVVSAPPPRPVRTRFGTTPLLLELLLGDDTRAGLAVTFWLAERDREASPLLLRLRARDVVLLRDVALGVFRGRVYGQGLPRGRTRVALLHRPGARGGNHDGDDETGYYSAADLRAGGHPQVEKTRRVRDWVLRFVGGEVETARGGGGENRGWDRPPDDTQ